MNHPIHHITAIASDAKECIHFYTTILGLSLVKKTVNQDDVSTYHLFFGDTLGNPGMDLTFFIFQPHMQGRAGIGQVTKVSFAVPETSLDFWQKRFIQYNVKHQNINEGFNRKRVLFWDSDGLQLELVGITSQEDTDTTAVWLTPDISIQQAIRYFHSATLTVPNKRVMELLIQHILGFSHVDTGNNTHLYSVSDTHRGGFLEIEEQPTLAGGLNAAGTVHHIAFRVGDEVELESVREKISAIGLYPTEKIDRFYFKSVYFRTPDGILFEIATDGPGFTADQTEQELGKVLALPPFLEDQREEIEKNLPQLDT